MVTFDRPQEIAHSFQIDAEALLKGECDLRRYPFRHLAVVAQAAMWKPDTTTVILMAAEHLSRYGWELVSVTRPFDTVNTLVAFLRLTTPPESDTST